MFQQVLSYILLFLRGPLLIQNQFWFEFKLLAQSYFHWNLIQIYFQRKTMQRISKDPYNAKPTYQPSSRVQTYQPNDNPPRQNTNSEKSHIPFHFFSIPNANTRSESQFRSPSPIATNRQQNYRQESVSPHNQSKISAYYSKNSPKKSQVGWQQQQKQPVYTKQPSQQPQHYQNESISKIPSPIYIGQDKNQRPQVPFTRNIPATDSHRRINSLFNNYTPVPQQRDRSPLNFITDMYRQDFQNQKYQPASIYSQPYQTRETYNSPQNKIEFRYSPPKETPQQVYPQYNYGQNTYTNTPPIRTAEVTKQSSPRNFQTNTDTNERPRCETYYNSSSFSKQSSPRASQGKNFYANKDPYDSARTNGEWNFFKAIANTKPTSVKVPDYKSSERAEVSKGGIGDFIKSLTSSKPASPKTTDARDFIQNLQYRGEKQGEANKKVISTDQVIKEEKKVVNTTDVYRITSEGNKTKNQGSSFQKSSISSQFSKSELSPQAEQKIKLLSEHVNELRDKLKNFHRNYGKIIKDYEQKDRKSKDNSFLNSQAYSQQIRKLQQQFQNKLMQNVKQLQEKIATQTANQEKLQKDLRVKEQKILQVTTEKDKLMKEVEKFVQNQEFFKKMNNQLNQSNEELRKEIAELQHAIHEKQADSKLKDELIESSREQINENKVKIQELQNRIVELQEFNQSESESENKNQLKSTNQSALKRIEEIEKEYRQALQESQEQVRSLQNYSSTLQQDIVNNLNNLLLIVKSMHPEKSDHGKLSTVTEEEEMDEDIQESWVGIMQKITKQLQKLHGELTKKEIELNRTQKQLGKYRKNELQGYYGQTPKKEPSLRRTSSTDMKDKDNTQKIRYLEESLEILQMQFSQELQSMRTTVSEKRQIEKQNKVLSKRVKELEDMIESPEKAGSEWDYNTKEVGSFFSVFNGQKTNKISSNKRSRKNISWAIQSMNVSEEVQQVKQYEEIKEEQEQTVLIQQATNKKQIKSLKQIEEMLSEAVICTSENIITEQISVPKSVLIYICDILEIPTSRKQYIQSLSHIDQNQQLQAEDQNPKKDDLNKDENNNQQKNGQSVLSTAQSGQTLLQNIINYLQNNCTAFVTQKLYREVLQFYDKQLQQMKKNQEDENQNITPLLISHKYLLRVLYKQKNKSKKISELEEQLFVACDQLEDEKQDHSKQKLQNERLESLCSRLSEKNDEIQKILSEQNEEIVRYHLELQNLKLSSIKTEDDKEDKLQQ